jgi:hypothetical protein
MVMSKLNVIAPKKLRRSEHSLRTWSDWHRSLPAYINLYTTSFCDVRKCDPNDRTNDKQISNALAKIHKSRGDLARVKTVNVVKNRWLMPFGIIVFSFSAVYQWIRLTSLFILIVFWAQKPQNILFWTF